MTEKKTLAERHTEKVFKGKVYVIVERCKGCNLCIEYCPKKILEISEEFNEKGYHYPIVIDEENCVNCKICEDICPEFSIYSIERKDKKK